ncbi:MAG: chemotaxis protein CheD [Lachnospiraceae bacterium]|nr:chemotaxis protein CheD [Lachnospiraceae bacterium]
MSEMIKVGMADLKLCKAPNAITTLGLGSCVGIAIRDPQTKVGGLAHIMLPDSKSISGNHNTAKFADTGVRELVNLIVKNGGNRTRLESKIAGGAKMFAFSSKSDLMSVGDRNVEAVKKVLAELRIPIRAQDTGDSYGRTVEYYPESGDYIIKSVGKGQKKI